MKKNIKKFKLHLIALIIVLSYSCSKDDPDGINEQEYISNVLRRYSKYERYAE